MVLSPETPLRSACSTDLQGQLAKDSAKLFFNQSGSFGKDKGSRSNFQMEASGSDTPWAPSDLWDQDESLMDPQGQSLNHLNFFQQAKGMGSLVGQNLFEGSGDSLRFDASGVPSVNPTLQDLMQLPFPVPQGHSLRIGSPIGSSMSKDKGTSDKDVKQETRAESSDGSDGIDDEDEKGGARSGRRHLSKNLVAERKRRKKLNERLYSLRALVPKITKMDRASILGDAIEYVKELQQQVKDLQDELLDPKQDDDTQMLTSNPTLDDTMKEQQQGETSQSVQPLARSADEAMESGKQIDQQFNPSMDDTMEASSSEPMLRQPMQVEVSKMDGKQFSLRIFCEKSPGLFVKLMKSLDHLGLDILHANVTTFRGLVLNVLNAENKDQENLLAEEVRECLLEMSSEASILGGNVSELPTNGGN